MWERSNGKKPGRAQGVSGERDAAGAGGWGGEEGAGWAYLSEAERRGRVLRWCCCHAHGKRKRGRGKTHPFLPPLFHGAFRPHGKRQEFPPPQVSGQLLRASELQQRGDQKKVRFCLYNCVAVK